MKMFVRTESGIYEFNDSEFNINNNHLEEIYEGDIPGLAFVTDLGEFIKQSDTIIELCDYVFLFDNEVTIKKLTHENDEDTIEYLKECIELGMKIKLAILTDKGLIYVADMNNEGDLKLI